MNLLSMRGLQFGSLIYSVKKSNQLIRCSNGYSIIVSSQLVHENSSVIAFLEPKGCIPVDCVLLSSKLAYTCLWCTEEAAIEVFFQRIF